MRYCVLAFVALAFIQPALADEPNAAPAAAPVKFERLGGVIGDGPTRISEKDGKLVLLMTGDMATWDGKELKSSPHTLVVDLQSIVRDDCGNSYALRSGVIEIKTDSNIANAAPALPKGEWTSLAADHISFVFVGGKGGMVSFDARKPEAGWVTFDKTELAGKEITALGVGTDGLVLAGTADGRIYRVERIGAATTATRFDAGVGDKPVRAIYAATDGGPYAVAGGALYRAAAAADAWQKHWVQKASMPFGSHDVYGTVFDGKLYVPGGMADHGLPAKFTTYFREMFVYDPNADAWTMTEPMTEALCYSGLAVLDKKVWVIGGGKNIGEGGKHKRVPVDVVHVYDAATKKWQIGPKLPHPIMESVVVETGGRIYSIGGMDSNEHRMTEVLSIAAGESQWRPEPNAPMGVQQAAGCVIDGVIYVSNMQTGLMSFDPKAGTWDANLPKTPDVTGPSAPLCTAYKGEVWVIGGYGNREVVEELPPASQPAGAKGTPKPRIVRKQVPLNQLNTWHYNPKTRTWAAGPALPTPRCWGAAVDLNGHLYITGGGWSSHGLFLFHASTFMLKD